jgi:phage-related protein
MHRVWYKQLGETKKFAAVFYRSSNGTEPVRDWLRNLTVEDRRVVGFDIAVVEYGWPVGMPLCRSLGEGLWEIRVNLPQGRIIRVLFCAFQGKMILLHAFEKKSQKTPQRDLDIARARQGKVAL